MEPIPISASLGAMGSLTRKLDGLLATRHWLRGAVTDEIEQLAADLRTLRDLLAKLSNAQDPPVAARYWMKDVRELSYDMSDCADQFVRAVDRARIHRAARRKIIGRLKVSRLPGRWKWRPWIVDKVSEFRSRAQEATRRYWRYKFDDFASSLAYPGVGRELPAVLPDLGDLVGIEGPMDELHRRLTSGGEQLKVVSIVGVGGIGKTTLAQKLWSKLRGQFECRAFVRTAQKPDMRGIIRSILSQVRRHQPPNPGEMHHLIRDLREYLRDKRYFVIIDDLWATSIWDVLSRAFPEGNCCSRIITTTEIMEVALASCDFCPEHIYQMESLSDDDSQKLLLQRILFSGNQQFDNVLPQIKRISGGLPLAIIIAASLLSSQPEKLEQLGCMKNSFGANDTMEGFMGQILNITFNSLPHYLKTCLLYLSTYPDGCLFLKGDLVKQWIAEGFICAKEGKDMEEVAGSYFDELVSTGLIQAMDINYNYEVLSYSVHHMVLDLIAYKSIEENFITVVDYSQTAVPVTDKVRRLSLHFGSATYATAPSSIRSSQVRSLFFSGLLKCVPSLMVFKLLRVLVLHIWSDIGNMSFSLEGICELFWLRYLQVTCNVTVKLPDQIESMKHLETLEINAGICAVPLDIVRLSDLLHLRLRSGANLPNGARCMTSLRTLMYFDLDSSSEDNLWELGWLTNLRDLHLTYSSSLSSEHLKQKLIALGTSLGKLGNLKSFTLASGAAGTSVLFDASSSMYSTPVFLERLELLPPICIFSRFPEWIGQLHKLSVLKIAVRELLMNDINSLTGLHSLAVLSLRVQTAPEQRIVFNDGTFPVLKYFKFRCGVLYLSFMSGSMRNLGRLKLHFNKHIGEKYDNMLAGVEHLLNIRDIAAHIGATTESDRKVIESALKDAISNHPRCPNFYVKWVDPVEEEYHPSERKHQRQERGLSGEKHGVLEKAEATNKYADDWLSPNSDQASCFASCRLKSAAESKVSQATEAAESETSQAIEVAKSEASQATKVAESKALQAIRVAESEASQATEIEESKESPATEVAESKVSWTYPYKIREVEFLKDELRRLQGFLGEADSKRRLGDAGVAILVSQIRDAAYEADNVIEAAEYMQKRNRPKKGFKGAIARYARLPSDLTTLHKVGAEIKRIRRKISEIFESANRLKLVDLGNTSVDKGHADDELIQDYGPMHQNFEDIDLVGFENEYQEIVEKLVDKENSLSAISIVAMGGAGKTTLARKVYTSSRVKQHFGQIAWVTVSQKYKSIELLKDIMKQIMESRDELVEKMDEYEVGNKIHYFLLQRRYLVVLDDVWQTDTWEQLNRIVKAFPDATNGSRVLLTTRKEDVANRVQMPTHVHHLKKLDEEKSWELFSSKALPPYKRSAIRDVDEFEKLGKKLAKKCDGLPLALAILGGYLSKNLNPKTWSDILSDWPSTKNRQMMRNMLARSYKDLPNHYLRACLLFLAAFPKDHVISVSDLIQLWIAESFIPHTPKHILEETAQSYVTELAQRSLVQVVHRSRAHGWIERIRIHDILHDWCIEEARQDGFLNAIDKTAGQASESSSSDNLISYRFSFQTLRDQILPVMPNARSLLVFELKSVSLPKLRFLRVLCIENSILKDISSVTGGCIHLRLLRMRRCGRMTLPSSIGKLLYLQTIDVKGTRLNSGVPNSLWDIPTLRHVYLSSGRKFSPPPPARSSRPLSWILVLLALISAIMTW